MSFRHLITNVHSRIFTRKLRELSVIIFYGMYFIDVYDVQNETRDCTFPLILLVEAEEAPTKKKQFRMNISLFFTFSYTGICSRSLPCYRNDDGKDSCAFSDQPRSVNRITDILALYGSVISRLHEIPPCALPTCRRSVCGEHMLRA